MRAAVDTEIQCAMHLDCLHKMNPTCHNVVQKIPKECIGCFPYLLKKSLFAICVTGFHER